VAVTPPPAVRERLHAHAASLGNPNLRVLPAENLHVTVLFLGNVARERIEELAGRLADVAAAAEPFSLEIAGAGPGPPRRPSMLWAYVEGADPLLCLSRDMSAAAAGLAPHAADPQRVAHITLARSRGTLRGVARATIELDRPSFQVIAVELMRSQLSPRGARYETVTTLPLGVTTA
jgi:2'-5' RNA ligase